MIGKPVHTAPKERIAPELMFSSKRALLLSTTDTKVKWLFCFDFSYVQPTMYSAIQMKNSIRSTSAINPVTKENTDDFCSRMGSHASRYCEYTPSAVQQKNGIQRRTKVSP